MSKTIFFIAICVSLFFMSCNNKSSLQQYFVQNQDQPNFVSVDISPSILTIDKLKLTSEEVTILSSFQKINVLVFKVNQTNKRRYTAEKSKLVAILKDTTNYHQLIKFGSGAAGASISFVGDEKHIDEFVLFGNKKENGFAVARILGNDMKPENALKLFSILQKATIDSKQLDFLSGILSN